MTKARYEFFLFLKASRLRYPARMSTNPMPTPPPKEAVLPFFIYPTTPPTIRTSPYGIVKQKSCIFSNWVFSGKFFEVLENLSSTKVFFFLVSISQIKIEKFWALFCFGCVWTFLWRVEQSSFPRYRQGYEYDVVFRRFRVADTSTTVSTHNRARVVFVQLFK